MDWRSVSRSRSRMSMDWRPNSRDRSRVPRPFEHMEAHSHTLLEQDEGSITFPSLGDEEEVVPGSILIPAAHGESPTGVNARSATIPIPTSSNSSNRSSRLHDGELPFFYSPSQTVPNVSSSGAEHSSVNPFQFPPHQVYLPPNHVSMQPGSLPVHTLNQIPYSILDQVHAIPPHGAPPLGPQQRGFPRYVRKTSFDHTVSRTGIIDGAGRHQFNGRPVAPGTSLVSSSQIPYLSPSIAL